MKTVEPITNIPNLSQTMYIDQKTGRTVTKFYWKRKEIPKVKIAGKLADRASGLTLILKDIDSALKWIQEAKKLAQENCSKTHGYWLSENRATFDLVKALFVASLTFYAKCFTEANGRSAQASRNWLDEAYRSSHDYFMNYRHNFAAHSGDQKIELATTYVPLHPNKKKGSFLPFLLTSREQPDIFFTTQDEIDLEHLLIHMKGKVNERYGKLADTIFHELVYPKGIDFWRTHSKKTTPVKLEFPNKK